METRHRAVKDADKLERRQDLLDAAWQLFESTPYDEIAVADIAERAGLAKGTVYLYFKTKEEAFLGVTQQQLESWFDELDARLERFALGVPAHDVARAIAGTLTRRPALLRLLAMLHTTLEQNADVAAVRAFKHALLRRLAATGARLEHALPFLHAGDGPHVLLQLYALVIGFQHLAHPAPAAREVIMQDKLKAFELSFGREFQQAAEALLAGLQARSG